MSSDRFLTEVERQKKYLDRLPQNFSFPLFNARYAVESQRKSGYRTTASAAREIVDNAIEAGADQIHVIFDTANNSKGKKVVTAVAFIDNGSGMLPEMARFALTWGGGTHFDDPNFIGKFGFGLPNSSINQTRRTEVFTRISGDQSFVRACLDLDKYSEFNTQTIPEPVEAELPDFVQRYLKFGSLKIDHGTIVVWCNPDRLLYKTPANLKEHLVDDFGVTYRYLLAQKDNPFNIVVEGIQIMPVDPLFLMPEGRYYLPKEEGGAICTHDETIPVRYYLDAETGQPHLNIIESEEELDGTSPNTRAISTIQVRVSRLPKTFAVGVGADKSKKTDLYRRFEIRKPRRGMSFVRVGREIDTVDVFPKSDQDTSAGLGDWPLLQSYAYYWGIEVKFGPELDDIFGITNDKQGVRPTDDFWRVLTQKRINEFAHQENNWQKKHRKKETPQAEPSKSPSPAEQAASDADKAAATSPKLPDYAKPVAKKKLEDKVNEEAEQTGTPPEEVLKALEQAAKQRPYRIDYFNAEYGPFYRPEWQGTQIVVSINQKHPFYDTLYGSLLNLKGGEQARQAVDLLLISLARAELTVEDQDIALWYETQREQRWSPYLNTAMKSLKQHLQPTEEEDAEAEFVQELMFT